MNGIIGKALLLKGIIPIEDVEFPVKVEVVFEDETGYIIRYESELYKFRSYVPKQFILMIGPDVN